MDQERRIEKMEERRNIWMDLLKIVSAYAIVLIHISGSRYYGTFGSDDFLKGLLFNASTRFAVPCFLLITGALTMKKERYPIVVALRRAKKYLFLLLGASFVYLFAKCILWQGCEKNFLAMYWEVVAANRVSGHLWYLYQLVWIWLMIPFVQLLYHKSSVKQRLYFVVFTVFLPGIFDFAGRMFLEHPLDLTPAYSITIQAGYIGMLVLGGILSDAVKKYSGRKETVYSVFACIGSFAILCMATIKLSSLRGYASDELFFELRLPALLYGCSVFFLFGSFSNILRWKLTKGWRNTVAKTAESLLFVYVWHCLLQWVWNIERNSIRNLLSIAAAQFLICVMIHCIGKKFWKIIMHPALAVLIFFVVFCMFCHTDSPWAKVLPWVDSDVFLYGGWAMHQGDILYVDFFDHKGPYLYFLQWIGWGLTNSFSGVWFVELVFVCIAVTASYRIVRIMGISEWTSAVIVMAGYSYLATYLCLGNYTEAYVLPMICVSAFIFRSYFVNRDYDLTFWQCMALGILFLMAFLIRPNSIAVWIVFCVAITFHQIWLRNYKNVGKYIMGFLFGTGISFMPVIIYLTRNQAWDGFFEFFQFNFKYIESNEDKMGAAGHFLLTWIAIFSLLGILSACIKKMVKRQSCLDVFCYLGWYLLSMYFTAMAGQPWDHYGCMMLPVYVIGMSLLFQEMKTQFCKMKITKNRYVTVVFILLAGIVLFICDPHGSWKFIKNHEWVLADSPGNDLEVKEIAERIRQDTDVSEKISVFGNACKYYLASGRKSVSKWIYQYPLCEIDQTIGETYLADLEAERPAAVIVDKKQVFDQLEDRTAQKLKGFLEQSYYCSYEGENAMLFFRN